MKNFTKNRLNKESLVSSPDVKDVVGIVNKQVDNIVPKKQIDFEKIMVEDISKLWDKEKLTLINKYRFLKDEKYIELLEELWDIDESQVVWEWMNALIINNLDDSTKVRKISKMWKDDVLKELKNHNKIFDILKEIKRANELYANIKIPEVIKSWNEVSFFMEKIPGHTPKSDFYLSLYKDFFVKSWIWLDEFVWLSDEYIDRFLKERNIKRLPEPSEIFFTPKDIRIESQLQEWWNKEYNSERFTIVRKAIDEIEKKWGIKIEDRNPWNFMFTPDWNIYIIDFWQLEIK